MPPERLLLDATPGENPTHESVQQIIEAESGKGVQGIRRVWQAAASNLVVLISDASGLRLSRDAGVTAPTAPIVDGTTAAGDLSGTYPNPTLSVAIMDTLVPPGTIWAYGGGGVPAGWTFCNGAAHSRTGVTARLFAAIGTMYGAGDTVSTFNVPNLLGRVVLGISAAHARGDVGGAETAAGPAHTHPGSHSHGMAAHLHGMNGHTHPGGSHTHSAAALGVGGTIGQGDSRNGLAAAGGVTLNAPTHSHDASGLDVTGSTDGGGVVASGPPSIAATAAAAPATSDFDSTAPSAAYGATTVPTLPPFQAVAYIIRIGA